MWRSDVSEIFHRQNVLDNETYGINAVLLRRGNVSKPEALETPDKINELQMPAFPATVVPGNYSPRINTSSFIT